MSYDFKTFLKIEVFRYINSLILDYYTTNEEYQRALALNCRELLGMMSIDVTVNDIDGIDRILLTWDYNEYNQSNKIESCIFYGSLSNSLELSAYRVMNNLDIFSYVVTRMEKYCDITFLFTYDFITFDTIVDFKSLSCHFNNFYILDGNIKHLECQLKKLSCLSDYNIKNNSEDLYIIFLNGQYSYDTCMDMYVEILANLIDMSINKVTIGLLNGVQLLERQKRYLNSIIDSLSKTEVYKNNSDRVVIELGNVMKTK